MNPLSLTIGVSLLMLAVLTGIGGYQYYTLSKAHEETQSALTRATTTNAELASEQARLKAELEAEQARNGSFSSQIQSIAQTVGVLDKLARTDEELLAKYSKVYFLNENYAPAMLASIATTSRYSATKQISLHAQVAPFLEALIADAQADGVDIRVLSGYRSFDEQAQLKSGYKVTYGKGANAFSADQGYSEHQLGTTVDFTTQSLKGTLAGFDKTPAYAWLTKHAHEYGFVLSYPKGNAYYIYEPWHWRFVGVKLATRLAQDDAYFYNLDQREIDAYLEHLFDSLRN